MKHDEIVHIGDYEARVIQVGEVQPQWAILVFASALGRFIRTTDEGVKGMFEFHGYKSVEDAKRVAEIVLSRHNPALNLENLCWKTTGVGTSRGAKQSRKWGHACGRTEGPRSSYH